MLWFESCSPKSYIQILSPQYLWMWPYLENWVLVDVIKLRWGHTGLRWTLNPMTSVFVERGNLDRGTWSHTERCRRRLGWCVYRPRNAKNCQHGTDSLLEALEGMWSCWDLCIRLVASRLRINFCYLEAPSLWSFVPAASGSPDTSQPVSECSWYFS